MSKKENKTIGRIGEDLALSFLQEKGFVLVQRNWGKKWGEIDIICMDQGVLVFVEVKTKRGVLFGSPEEMVGWRKLSQIQRIASVHPNPKGHPVRIDVVAVVLTREGVPVRTTHYEAVY